MRLSDARVVLRQTVRTSVVVFAGAEKKPRTCKTSLQLDLDFHASFISFPSMLLAASDVVDANKRRVSSMDYGHEDENGLSSYSIMKWLKLDSIFENKPIPI
jgi:hypothetical protein